MENIEKISFIKKLIKKQKNKLYSIDRKYNEESRKYFNNEEHKLQLLRNILELLKQD